MIHPVVFLIFIRPVIRVTYCYSSKSSSSGEPRKENDEHLYVRMRQPTRVTGRRPAPVPKPPFDLSWPF